MATGNQTVVQVAADTTGYVAEMARAQKSAADFMTSQDQLAQRTKNAASAVDQSRKALKAQGDDAVAAFNKSAKQAESFLKSIQQQAEQAGKTRSELLQMRAAQLGVAGAAQQYIDQIEKASVATGHLQHGSVGARREMLVLAHEASQGQWKNFAGSLMVLGEQLDIMGKLLSPVGIGIGALAAASYLAYEAIHSLTEEHKELNRALVLTNNFANLTQGALISYSQIISGELGVSTSDARDALMAMASSGKVAGADLKEVSESIAAYAKFTGESVKDTAKTFAESYGQAGEAAKKWAETHHDLSQAQIEYIDTLEKSGDKAGAWKQFVLDASSKAREAVIADNHAMAGSYESLGDAWSRFWRGIVGHSDELTKISDRIAQLRSMEMNADLNPGGTQTDGLEQQIKQLEAQRDAILNSKQAQDEQTKAVDRFNSMSKEHIEDMKTEWDWRQKLNDANKTAKERTDALIESARAAGKLTPQLQAQLQGDLQKTLAYNATQFKAPHQSNRGYVESKGDSLLDDAQKANAVLKEQVSNGERMNTWAAKYAGLQATIDGYQGKTLTKAQESIKAHQAVLLPLYAQNAALESQLQTTENSKKLNADRIALNDKLQAQNDAIAAQHQIELDSVNMTNEGRERALKLLQIETARQKELAEWAKKASDLKLDGSEADTSEQARINALFDERRADQAKTFQQQDINKGDWMGGAKKGLKEIIEQTSNLRDIATNTATNAIGTLGDAFATLATTGKLNIGDLTKSIVADFIKIEAEALMARAAMSAMTAFGFADGGVVTAPARGFATGGQISGPGTGTSDSIPIMVSNGEYIMRAEAVRRIGVDHLDAMNSGASVHSMARFASGGYVGSAASTSRAGGGDITVSAPVTVQGGSDAGANASGAADLQKKITAAVRAVVVNERRQGGALWKMQQGIA